jgi:hypothetical protein
VPLYRRRAVLPLYRRRAVLPLYRRRAVLPLYRRRAVLPLYRSRAKRPKEQWRSALVSCACTSLVASGGDAWRRERCRLRGLVVTDDGGAEMTLKQREA